MLETHHQNPQRARRGLVPLAVSALLAFALVPGLAFAEAGIQYSDAPPTVTGKTADKNSANRSNTGGGGDGSGQSSTRSGSTADGNSKDGAGDGQGGAAGGRDGGNGGAGGDRAGGQEVGNGVAPLGTDLQSSADDGGSSPLVPILIALAVLAAISVGVVAMRKKREDMDPGAPASPEAG